LAVELSRHRNGTERGVVKNTENTRQCSTENACSNTTCSTAKQTGGERRSDRIAPRGEISAVGFRFAAEGAVRRVLRVSAVRGVGSAHLVLLRHEGSAHGLMLRHVEVAHRSLLAARADLLADPRAEPAHGTHDVRRATASAERRATPCSQQLATDSTEFKMRTRNKAQDVAQDALQTKRSDTTIMTLCFHIFTHTQTLVFRLVADGRPMCREDSLKRFHYCNQIEHRLQNRLQIQCGRV
jgi:hypothetical protein